MHQFGFKVVDKNSHLLVPILDYAVQHGRPLEVGLYSENPGTLEWLAQRLCNTTIAVNAHTNHERFHAFNLHQTLDLLEAHIRLARTLGSAYSILHTAYLPLPLHQSRRPALFRLLLDNLQRAEEVCTVHDYRLHLENTYHPIALYRDLFEGIRARGLTRIHFCFDIGHAKVWSGDDLEDWIVFLDDLKAMGFKLHCHLHANRGLTDEHLSMAEVKALGISGADDEYNPYGYPEAFWVIERRFPEVVKVFEVKPEEAIANLEAVMTAAPIRPAKV